MIHLKIYLKNYPKEIQQFSVSHGYNQLFLNRSCYKLKYGLKIGAGVVLAHPENTIRDFTLDEKKGIMNWGYYLTGPVLQIGLFKEVFLTKRFNLLIESKISFAYANVPVSGGRAHVPVFGYHLQLGPGFYFVKKGR